MPPNVRTLQIAFALIACFGSAAAFAQETPAPVSRPPASPGHAMRLTDEQREAILNANTEEDAAAARGELTETESPGPGIHGEMGVMIGSHGTRGVYGTADIPLGENSGATISFESSRFGYPRSRPKRR